MFNIGAGEMMVIFLLALLVLGPDKLPETARKVGRVMADLRRMSNGFQQEMRQAMDIDGLKPNEGPTLPAMDTTSTVVDKGEGTSDDTGSGTTTDGSTPKATSGSDSAAGSTAPTPADAPTEIKASAREKRPDRSDGPPAHGEQGAA